jgi:hypothetical protein
MNCNDCDGCGKGYPEVKQIFFCKCFLAGFCSPECFENSTHPNECELIDGPLNRLRGKSAKTDFSELLRQYAQTMKSMLEDYRENATPLKIAPLQKLTDTVILLNDERQDYLKNRLREWNVTNVAALKMVMEGLMLDVRSSFEQAKENDEKVIRIFVEENRLSLRQTRKDIAYAWNNYVKALQTAILLGREDFYGALDAFDRAAGIGFDAGRTLSGGKNVHDLTPLEEEEILKSELIEGPLSRARGKNEFGSHLHDYTWALYQYAKAEGAEKQMERAKTFAVLIEIKARDSTREQNLRKLLDAWNNKNLSAIDDMQRDEPGAADAKLNQVKTASNSLIAIFKSENRLSLRQRGKDIENAWNAYLQSLTEAIKSIPQGSIATYTYDKFNASAEMAINAGNVLGGGKDMTK